MASEHLSLQQELSLSWYWILVYCCCFSKRGRHSVLECQQSFTCDGLGALFLMEKETGFSPHTVSCGIPAIICDSCPLLASCMRREQKQSNPRANSVWGGGPGAARLPYCSSEDRNRQVVTAGTSSHSTPIQWDWSCSYRQTQQQMAVLKSMPIGVLIKWVFTILLICESVLLTLIFVNQSPVFSKMSTHWMWKKLASFVIRNTFYT